ncbi:YceI-like domain-containing protein [Parapedobacter luteus]|uniref:YceI-like domain-containing protein n=1 Tax=Parapedobacter luteus TaxID=623280 RepID=A0A1T5BQ51_9SPHI|nr:YceI family protein [Parapedobacter luteus]SKB49472.1 YceI-like domain-containing protein [Parapedobacter luteus]
MKRTINLASLRATALMIAVASFSQVKAQTTYQSSATQTTIKGTSTLHDWNMTSAKGQTKATFTIEGDQVSGITALTFTLPAESLKSDKSGLDKNAYKALATDKHATISFSMTSGTLTPTGKNTFQVRATGNLTIAGTTRPTTITATGQYSPTDKSITVKGATAFKMTGYNVKPPTVMMGTIKTGDEITVDYSLKLTPQ